MAFELLSDENREILYSPYCLPIHQKFLVPGSRSYAAIGSFGSMLFQELEGSDFQIHYSNYLLKERAAFKARSEYALVELQFCMHSDEFYNLSGIGEVSMKKYHYNITYIPFTENRVSFSNRRYCTFDVHYSLDFLHRLSPHFPLLSAFLEKIDHQVAAQICPQANPATGDMLAIIRSVLQCRLEGPMKTLFLESKVKELLIRALEQYNFPAPAPALNLRPYEVEQIRQARELLMQGMEEPLTIKELSRKVGINDYKLNRFSVRHYMASSGRKE